MPEINEHDLPMAPPAKGFMFSIGQRILNAGNTYTVTRYMMVSGVPHYKISNSSCNDMGGPYSEDKFTALSQVEGGYA